MKGNYLISSLCRVFLDPDRLILEIRLCQIHDERFMIENHLQQQIIQMTSVKRVMTKIFKSLGDYQHLSSER